MRALLIDDERLARAELRRLLAAHPEVEIVGEAVNAADAAQQIGRKLSGRFHVSSTDAGRRLAASGQAIAILPSGMVEPYADILGLRLIEIDEKWAERALRLISRKAANLPAATRLLRDGLLSPR